MKIYKAMSILQGMMDNTDYDDEFNALSLAVEALIIVNGLKMIFEEDDNGNLD